MNFFINSPMYYTTQYGIDDNVYKFCSYISKNINITKYTTEIETFAITPIIAPKSLFPDRLKQVKIIVKAAYVSIPSSFEDYVDADIREKEKIITENIINSAKTLKKKLKSKFNLDLFLSDLEKLILEY